MRVIACKRSWENSIRGDLFRPDRQRQFKPFWNSGKGVRSSWRDRRLIPQKSREADLGAEDPGVDTAK